MNPPLFVQLEVSTFHDAKPPPLMIALLPVDDKTFEKLPATCTWPFAKPRLETVPSTPASNGVQLL
jgi:hypothetical protein